MPAALNTPDIPKGRKPPAPAVRLATSALPAPERTTNRMQAMFNEQTVMLNLDDSRVPTHRMADRATTSRSATGSVFFSSCLRV